MWIFRLQAVLLLFSVNGKQLLLPSSAHSKAVAGSKIRRALAQITENIKSKTEEEHGGLRRDLVWAETSQVCDEQNLNSALSVDPTIDLCYQGEIQWDKESTLEVSWRFRNGYTTFLGSTINVPITTYVASYQNRGFCDLFDGCSSVSSGDILFGQYAYDCSNIYCGPNARLDCNGNYQDTVCPAGVDPASLFKSPNTERSTAKSLAKRSVQIQLVGRVVLHAPKQRTESA